MLCAWPRRPQQSSLTSIGASGSRVELHREQHEGHAYPHGDVHWSFRWPPKTFLHPLPFALRLAKSSKPAPAANTATTANDMNTGMSSPVSGGGIAVGAAGADVGVGVAVGSTTTSDVGFAVGGVGVGVGVCVGVGVGVCVGEGVGVGVTVTPCGTSVGVGVGACCTAITAKTEKPQSGGNFDGMTGKRPSRRSAGLLASWSGARIRTGGLVEL